MENQDIYPVCRWRTDRQSILDHIAGEIDYLLAGRHTGTFTLTLSRPDTMVGTDILIERLSPGTVRIAPFSRRGNGWMKENSISYRGAQLPNDINWKPDYTLADATAIAEKAHHDGLVVDHKQAA